ncbi:DNA gyrase inhibitor YacG, partial [Klebsiella michiganensis]
MNDNDQPVDPPRACPICGKPALVRFKPFCSKRCAEVDLHRWLSGSYV